MRYERLIDRLLASPHYGERWARHWMDVARYAEDNATSEATNPPYPFAWRYRDWMIEALNAGMPYDRFIKLQIAADLMPNATRDDMRALGYVGAAPMYHHDLRLSGEVIGTFLTDDWDERIDAVSRGVLGCVGGMRAMPRSQVRSHHAEGLLRTDGRVRLDGAGRAPDVRCRSQDRTAIHVAAAPVVRHGVLGEPARERGHDVYQRRRESGEVESRSGKPQRRGDHAARQISAARGEPGEVLESAAPWRRTAPCCCAAAPPAAGAKPVRVRRLLPPIPRLPLFNRPRLPAAAARRVRPSRTSTPCSMRRSMSTRPIRRYTFIIYKPGEPRDMPILKAGNVAMPGDIVPRGFPAVLAKGETTFKQGSGRLELADRIFTDTPGLAARVIVNRVWGWHFGRALVATPSDFGTQGDKPTHPQLLDDLAARFIEHGWSLKWLSKEIMLSAAYQQTSKPRADALKADEANALLWRQNPRRLDIEAYRDTLLRSAGMLDEEMGGVSGDLDSDTFFRRSIYGRISRARMPQLMQLYDFPEATQSAPGREVTITTLQQIFLMNSEFVQNLAAEAAKSRGGGNWRSRTGRPVVSPDSRARPDGRRDKERARISTEGHPAALCASPAVDQRGDFPAMNLKLTRREMIETLGGGVGLVGLAGVFASLSKSEVHAAGLGNYAGPALPAKAKHVIMIYLNGGPSQLDMFDPKPALFKYAGQRPNAVDLRTERVTGGLLPSPFEFKRYGRNGVEVSELSAAARQRHRRHLRHSIDVHLQPDAHAGTGPVPHRQCARRHGRPWGRGFRMVLARRTRTCRRLSRLARTAAGPQTRSAFLPTEYQGVGFQVADPDPEKIIPNLRNKQVDAAGAANRHGRAARPQPELLEVVWRRPVPRGPHQVDGDGLSHAVRGVGSVRHPQRAGEHPGGVRATGPSEPGACWRGGWSKPACGTSTSIIPAGRSGTTIGTSTTIFASAAPIWIKRPPR